MPSKKPLIVYNDNEATRRRSTSLQHTRQENEKEDEEDEEEVDEDGPFAMLAWNCDLPNH